MADLFTGIASSLANKLLDSHSYPLTLRFAGSRLVASAPEPVVVPDVPLETATRSDGEAGILERENGEDFLDVAIDGFLTVLGEKNTARTKLNTAEQALFDLFEDGLDRSGEDKVVVPGQQNPKKIVELTQEDIESFEAAGLRTSALGLGSLWKSIKKALKKVGNYFVREFQRFLREYFRFTLNWTELRINKKPGAEAGNPIRLKSLDFHARVEIEACIKIGKWRCATITSPWIAMEAGAVEYQLSVAGLKMYGRPRVKDMNLVFKINLFGFKFDVKVGVTDFVNKELDEQKPAELVDFSVVQFAVETLNRKFVIETVKIGSGPDYVEAEADGRFIPMRQ